MDKPLEDNPRELETWERVREDYRTRFNGRFGNAGKDWNDYEPGWRYAWQFRSKPEFRHRQWREAEPELERGWLDFAGAAGSWDKVRDSVKSFWEDVSDKVTETVKSQDLTG